MKESLSHANEAFNRTFEAEGLQLNIMKNASFTVGAGYEPLYLRDALHTHFCYEFFYVMEGILHAYVEDKEYQLTAGSLFLVRPDERHYTIIDQETGVSCLGFLFAVEYKNKKTKISETVKRFLTTFVEPLAGDGVCHSLACLLNSAMMEKQSPFCGSYLLSLLLACASVKESGRTGEGGLLEDKEIYRINRMEYLCQALFVKKELTTSLLARELHLSERQVERLFKKQYGCRLKERVARMRIKEAVALLREGMRVAKVAETVGYCSLSAFYRDFRTYQGHSPGSVAREGGATTDSAK